LICEQRAIAKLKAIISREGDVSGERLRPEYLQQLTNEEMRTDIASAIYDGNPYKIEVKNV
jgi:hypothetical protein